MSTETVEYIQKLIKEKPVFIASKAYCPYCTETKKIIESITSESHILELDELDNGAELQDALVKITNHKTVPFVFIAGEFIGGDSDVQALSTSGELEPKVKAAF